MLRGDWASQHRVFGAVTGPGPPAEPLSQPLFGETSELLRAAASHFVLKELSLRFASALTQTNPRAAASGGPAGTETASSLWDRTFELTLTVTPAGGF